MNNTYRQNIRAMKRVAHDIELNLQEQWEANRRYDAEIAVIESEWRDELERLGADLRALKEQRQELIEATATARASVKHQHLRDAWQRWRTTQDAILNGRKWTAAVRNLVHFAADEMAHFNNAYHAGQRCTIP